MHEAIAARPVDEASVIARVTRYSSLRGVERALLPSVRRRIRLPTTRLGNAILTRLQALLDIARAGDTAVPVDGDFAVRELAAVDETLGEFASALTEMIDETPIAQLRSTLPPLLDRARGEVAALLDLSLESFDPRPDGEPPYKIDYLVTLLSRQRVGDLATLRCDPCTVTPGVLSRCETEDLSPDYHAPEFARLFRDARIELLSVDDLEEIVGRMRQVKGRLGPCLFDRDVLRAVVCYNIAAENRFKELFQLEHRKDAAIERTLRALSQLDMASPDLHRAQDLSTFTETADETSMPADDAAGTRQSVAREQGAAIARRLAERIDPNVFDAAYPGDVPSNDDDPDQVLTRVAVLVGLALRDLPSMTARLRELDIDVPRAETDWVRELDEALQAAIAALSKSGRAEQAALLSRTRMRYLSGT